MSNNRPNSTNRYVALDVETTGLSPKKRIPWQVQQVHGITNEMLKGEPKPDEVWSEFYEFIAGSILVAHNASFDIGFLRHEFALLGMGLNNRSLCILKMSRKLYPHLPNHKLATVSRYLLGRTCNQMQRHRALVGKV